MSRLRLTVRAVLLTVALVWMLGQLAPAAAQPPTRPGAGRGQPAAEVQGVIRAVDTTKNSLTVAPFGRGQDAQEHTYTLAKDAEVLLTRRGRFIVEDGKLADLHAGAAVTLTLSPDRKQVQSLVASGATLRGFVKTIDAGKGTLTLILPARRRGEEGEEKALSVSKNAEVGTDDGRGRRFSVKEGKLADVQAGALVTAYLSIDGKSVEGLVAEGPQVFGVIQSVDGANITLRTGRGDDAQEKTYSLAKDAEVLVGEGGARRTSRTSFVRLGKGTDLIPGTIANLTLSADQKTAVVVRAEGPNVFGQLRKVGLDKGTITVLVGAGRGEAGEEKTYTLAKGAPILDRDKTITLNDLGKRKAGDGTLVSLKLSLDQKQIKGVFVVPPRE